MANYKVSAEVSADTSKFKKQIQAAKRVSEKFKKVVDKLKNNEVDANTANFDKKIDKSKYKAEKLDKMKIDPDVTADISNFSNKTNEVKAILDKLDKTGADAKIKADIKSAVTNIKTLQSYIKGIQDGEIDVNVDTKTAQSKIKNIESSLRALSSSKATAEIKANSDEALRKLVEARKALADYAKQRATAKLDVDSKLASAEVSRFKALLRSIPNKIKTRADFDGRQYGNALKGLNRQVDVFQDRMDRIAKSIRTFGTIGANTIQGTLLSSFSALIPVIGGLVPAIAAVGNATVALGGGAVGAAGAFGVLRLGITGFAGMAASAIQMLDKGMIQASNATNEYKSALSGVKSTWQSIVKENASQIFYAMASGIRSASNALNQMRPFLSGIAGLVNTNAAKLNTWVTSSGTAQRAFEALNTTGVKIFGNLLSAGGHFGDGLVEIFTQLMPLFEWS
ncbi:TPA: phage tail protein, partial [Staphylococcus aureus]|nr:phage tail protein [Staphylococcus aureus]